MGVKVRQMFLGRFDEHGGRVKQTEAGFDKATPRYTNEWWLQINHKGHRQNVKVGSKAAAMTAKKKIEEGLAAGAVLPGAKEKVLFRERYTKWIGQHVGMSCEESTEHVYANIWKNHVEPYFGDIELSTIDREQIREFLRVKKEKGYAKNTIRNMKNVISGITELAIEDKVVEINPSSKSGKYLKDAKAQRKAEYLTPDEEKLLLDTAKGNFYPFFLTAVRTGLRQGELIGLQWGDIDWNGKSLMVRRTIYRKKPKVPKNGKTRKVDMSNQLIAVLRDHKKMMTTEALRAGKGLSEYVFTSRNHTTYEPSWIRKVFAKYLKDVGLRAVPFHALRHTYASRLIANNESLTYVKEQMGHHSIKVTVDTYGHLIPSANRSAVNKLDDVGDWSENACQAHVAHIPVSGKLINE